MENSKINYNEVKKLFELPFMDLIYKAHSVHRQFQEKNKIQVSKLLSIKTGKFPEDCKYCPQSARYNTGLKNEDLMQVKDVIATAKLAKEEGKTPVIALCEKNRPGFWVMVHSSDLEKIKK